MNKNNIFYNPFITIKEVALLLLTDLIIVYLIQTFFFLVHISPIGLLLHPQKQPGNTFADYLAFIHSAFLLCIYVALVAFDLFKFIKKRYKNNDHE